MTRINAELVADGNVVGFHVRADSTHVGYIANQNDPGIYELLETDQGAGVSTRLSDTLTSGGEVWDFTFVK